MSPFSTHPLVFACFCFYVFYFKTIWTLVSTIFPPPNADANCYVFDCSNTDSMVGGSMVEQQSASTANAAADTEGESAPTTMNAADAEAARKGTRMGNTCDFPAHTVSLYLDTYGCDACNICGDGFHYNPSSLGVNMMNILDTWYDCAYVEAASRQGFFAPDSCAAFARVAHDACDCIPLIVVDGDSSGTNTESASTTTDELVVIEVEEDEDSDVVVILDGTVDDTTGDTDRDSSVVNADPSCSAHSDCAGLEGECCPSPEGTMLGCCDRVAVVDPNQDETNDEDTPSTSTPPTEAPVEADATTMTESPTVLSLALVEAITTTSPTMDPTTKAPPVDEDTDAIATCVICPPGSTVNPDGVIEEPDGVIPVMSCAEVETIGTSGAIKDPEFCAAIQRAASGPCCGIESIATTASPSPYPTSMPNDLLTSKEPLDLDYCQPCGNDGVKIMSEASFDVVVSVPTQGMWTCAELQQAGEDGTLDNNGICPIVQNAASTPCCVASGPTSSPTVASNVDDNTNSVSAAPTAMITNTAVVATVGAVTAVLVGTNYF